MDVRVFGDVEEFGGFDPVVVAFVVHLDRVGVDARIDGREIAEAIDRDDAAHLAEAPCTPPEHMTLTPNVACERAPSSSTCSSAASCACASGAAPNAATSS